MPDALRRLRAQWAHFSATPHGIRLKKFARLLGFGAILAFLAHQLSEVGWGEIWRSLPRTPWFYLVLGAMYLLLPVSEAVIYGRTWDVGARSLFPVLIRKRVLNVDVLGYSGEFYLYLWAKDRLPRPGPEIRAAIKDNLILSSIATILAALVLLAALLATGLVRPGELGLRADALYVGAGCFATFLVATLLVRFRHVLFTLPRPLLVMTGAVHLSRFFLGYVLQVLQWWVVLPEVSMQTWAILLCVFVVINRIPLLPSSDLVFVGVGAELTPLLDVPVAPVVGMLLVRSALDRLLNLLFFTLTAMRRDHLPATEAAADPYASPLKEAPAPESTTPSP